MGRSFPRVLDRAPRWPPLPLDSNRHGPAPFGWERPRDELSPEHRPLALFRNQRVAGPVPVIASPPAP